ncbi:MAG TPA: hypothetical protein VL282_15205 [Tepidisphaeraceae bacterium]|jgi:hypothetical protein|nr:hypothetical protein [Tepidisphaeraceae bacterium]
MIPLFVGVTLVNLIALGVTCALGYAVSSGHDLGPYHQLAGVLATLACCGMHCIVFTYFIATAKWIQHAITVKHLDPALASPTRSFKQQAFPAALLAMAITFIAAVSGAITFSYRISPRWHHGIAITALVTNVIVAIVEYRAIARNGALIDDLLKRIGPSADPATIV